MFSELCLLKTFCYKMIRRITCYIVFATLVWGAHTKDEEKLRDMFKSNMTRNDFSNLLQSLINLNEQRVSVLQKLYRLEDYGVLSEVLRSGDKKPENGNPNNMYLIVMSKKQNDPSRRQLDFQAVDSVAPLDAGNNNIHPKLDFVLDPASFIHQNIRKENRLESIFGNISRASQQTKIHIADDRSKKNTTTTKTLKYNKLRIRTEVTPTNVLRAAKIRLKTNEDRKHHKETNRFGIVNHKGRHPSKKLLDDDGKSNNYPQTVAYNSQSIENMEKDFPIVNDKHILSSNHNNSEYPIAGKGKRDEDYHGSPFSNMKSNRNRQYTKMISDISIKKNHDHHNPKTNKYTPKVKVQSKQQKGKLTTKPIIIKDISGNHQNSKYPLEGKDEQDEDNYSSQLSNIKKHRNRPNTKKISHISIEKLHINNHRNPKTNKNTPKIKGQSNQQNYKLATKRITIKDILSSNRQNKYPLQDKDEQHEDFYGSPFSSIENDHKSQYTNKKSDVSIKSLRVNNPQNPKINIYTPKVKIQRMQQSYTLSTKPIGIEDIITSNHENTKYPLKDKDEQEEDFYGSPFKSIETYHNSQHININSDIPIKKLQVDNNHNPKINISTQKVTIQRKQQNYTLSTKPIIIEDITTSNNQNTKYPIKGKDNKEEDYYGSPISNIENDHNSYNSNINSDISIKKLHVHHPPNPKINKNILKIEFLSNQRLKLNENKSNLKNQGNRFSKLNPVIETITRKNDFRINYGTVNTDTARNHSIKNLNLNNDNINANNHDLRNTKIKHIDATKEIENNKFITLASENVYGSKPVIPETSKDTLYGTYPGFEDYKDVRVNSNKDKPETVIDTPYGSYPGLQQLKDVEDNYNQDKPKTVIDTPYGSYPGLQQPKDVRDIYNEDKPKKTAKDTPSGNYPGFKHPKDVRNNANNDKLNTNIATPFRNFHGIEHHKNVMDNLNKDKPNTAKELLYRDNLNAESKKDTDYYGVKMFDNGKGETEGDTERFSVFITHVANGTAEEVKQRNDPKKIQNSFDQPESKLIARKPFGKCLTKKAFKLCFKSCKSAYKNVCTRLKCTSRSKKALKKECKRSCKKTFASKSSKYSDENSDGSDENSDESESDDSS